MMASFEDMDVDFDLAPSDAISDFLHTKLDEVKSLNSQLNSALRHRKELASKLRAGLHKDETSMTLGPVWKKVLNRKYVLGMELYNTSHESISDLSISLSWTSASPLSYTFRLASSHPVYYVLNSNQIIITLDVPTFSDQLKHTIFGSVCCKTLTNTWMVKFPKEIQLNPEDLVAKSARVDLHRAVGGSIDDVLALLFSQEKYEFVLMSPNANQSFESVLEGDCNLRKIGLDTRQQYFLANKISAEVDGTIVEVQYNFARVSDFNVYCRDSKTLMVFLQYLHRCIIGVAIVPKSLYQSELSLIELVELSRKSLGEEIDELERSTDRCKLLSLEYKTDVLLSRIAK